MRCKRTHVFESVRQNSGTGFHHVIDMLGILSQNSVRLGENFAVIHAVLIYSVEGQRQTDFLSVKKAARNA